MVTKTKMRLVRAVVGVLSGAAITAVLFALLCFAYVFTEPGSHDYEWSIGWALVAAMSGGMFGYAGGVLLGLLLGLVRRGRIFGAISGSVLGVAVIAVQIVFGDARNWDTRDAIFGAALIPVTLLSGFFISLLLSAIPSFTRRTDRDQELLSLEQVLLSLEQNRTNEGFL